MGIPVNLIKDFVQDTKSSATFGFLGGEKNFGTVLALTTLTLGGKPFSLIGYYPSHAFFGSRKMNNNRFTRIQFIPVFCRVN
jgi:hypothetical protein